FGVIEPASLPSHTSLSRSVDSGFGFRSAPVPRISKVLEESVAVVTVSKTVGFDIRALNFSTLHRGDTVLATSTGHIVNHADGDSNQFRGTGFRYDSQGDLIGGTVSRYAEYDILGRLVV